MSGAATCLPARPPCSRVLMFPSACCSTNENTRRPGMLGGITHETDCKAWAHDLLFWDLALTSLFPFAQTEQEARPPRLSSVRQFSHSAPTPPGGDAGELCGRRGRACTTFQAGRGLSPAGPAWRPLGVNLCLPTRRLPRRLQAFFLARSRHSPGSVCVSVRGHFRLAGDGTAASPFPFPFPPGCRRSCDDFMTLQWPRGRETGPGLYSRAGK